MEFDIVQGGIAAQPAAALVNAAGGCLEMGSDVAGFDLAEGAELIAEEIRDDRGTRVEPVAPRRTPIP